MADVTDTEGQAQGDAASQQGTGATEQRPAVLETDEIRGSLKQMQADLREAQDQARKATEQARRAQSAADSNADRFKKQLAEQQRRVFEALPRLGLDADQVRTLQSESARDLEIDDLREQAARGQALESMSAAERYRNDTIKAVCEAAGIDPKDSRIDASDPVKLQASIAKAIREDERKAKQDAAPAKKKSADVEEEGNEPPRKSAREDLEVLGSGGGKMNAGKQLEQMLAEGPTGDITKWHERLKKLKAEAQK